MRNRALALTATALVMASGITYRADRAYAQTRASSPHNSQKRAIRKMEPLPLTCNMAAMTPVQRQRYGEIKSRLQAAVTEVKELPDGYAFRYKADPALLMAAAKFITLESRCCPFFNFALEVPHGGGPMWLRVTGPKDAKPFIRDALSC